MFEVKVTLYHGMVDMKDALMRITIKVVNRTSYEMFLPILKLLDRTQLLLWVHIVECVPGIQDARMWPLCRPKKPPNTT